ncbi:right-handed parallel beta-helix repeat-containing protein [Winogradskyella sp.]|uniref:right-handed parallel beta-helix repeat-containing protein n=1 Tax=Winogradskyella sp. TaxID=1883156 RepID=UPI002605DAB9|nr:right-handed parallel beta-helix repeat-containing protein [Winogradskyella sp.]
MKRLLAFFICLGIIVFWSSCREDFEFSPSTGNLQFERDTIYLDTVFTNIGSSTYNLKVYNRSDDDIVIPTIQLENGTSSFYRMNVDGTTGLEGAQEGKFFENIELLANDSLFIFIETTIDIETLSNSDTQFLYTDRILFDSGNNQQDVDLVTLVKDAIFIFADRDEDTNIIETLTFDVDGDGTPDETTLQGRFLENDELTFTNEKPYVIYGYAGVGAGQTLTMEPGARVHFHADSGIIVTQGGSLNINGALSTDQDVLENEVILEGDRLEPAFSEVPGQWGTIWLFSGSENNTINYATIKNATIGILSEGNQDATNDKLTITNSQIYNSSAFGILGRATSILAENLVINRTGQSSFAGTFGGKYNFTHCTIANYWNNSFRDFPSLLLNDFIVDENNTIFTNDLTEANFTNCIIYGNDNPEFLLENEGNTFNYKFTNCLLRFDNETLSGTGNYMFNDTVFYENNVFNTDPRFEDPFENLMRIGEDSGANGIALPLIPSGFDLLSNPRDNIEPDAGAYESITLED